MDASFGQTMKTLQAKFSDVLNKISQQSFKTPWEWNGSGAKIAENHLVVISRKEMKTAAKGKGWNNQCLRKRTAHASRRADDTGNRMWSTASGASSAKRATPDSWISRLPGSSQSTEWESLSTSSPKKVWSSLDPSLNLDLVRKTRAQVGMRQKRYDARTLQ